MASRTRSRTRSVSALVGLAVGALALSACGGPGSEEDLVAALTRDDTFTERQAECIAADIFEEYGEDDDALERISGAVSYEELTGDNGVEGFDEFFTTTVTRCTI